MESLDLVVPVDEEHIDVLRGGQGDESVSANGLGYHYWRLKHKKI